MFLELGIKSLEIELLEFFKKSQGVFEILKSHKVWFFESKLSTERGENLIFLASFTLYDVFRNQIFG